MKSHAVLCLLLFVWVTGCRQKQTAPTPNGSKNLTPAKPSPPPPPKVVILPPTDNHALFEAGAEETYFMPTRTDRPWTSGAFGCVRNNGGRMHEGLDIRPLRRDSRGEALDEIRAAANGVIAFINANAGASSYGRYIVATHEKDGLSFYTLYAHMAKITEGIAPQTVVKAGDLLGIMGRSANHDIPIERAHLHFEIGFMGSRDFNVWMRKHYEDPSFNKFSLWHGFNLLGLNPLVILREQKRLGDAFNLAKHVAQRPQLMRFRVRGANLPLSKRLPGLLVNGEEEPFAGHEIDVNMNGTPLRIRGLPDFPAGSPRYALVSVNEEVALGNRCRQLVVKTGARWQLTAKGHRLADLLATGVSN
ncbi:MAG: peptidase M23 [Verrucomicrobiales bacterium]|nr:peptidase M23 [Verrucomicrobiales bacterium]|tara:strand:- start:234 stop:1316 length:1083 start_codon:yes stop_codon:yes gene_type:complete